MSGPPGSGKTLLSRSMPSILPRMTPSEALDVTRIYSVAGMLPQVRDYCPVDETGRQLLGAVMQRPSAGR